MLKDKNIIITGASRGLGATAAKAFAKQGANLVLIARSKDDLNKVKDECSGYTFIVEADLTMQINVAIYNATKLLGNQVDVVLHCVGGGLGYKSPLLTRTQLRKLFELNIEIAADINSIIIPNMIKTGGGNIVHIGSIASSEGIGSVGYNTVKSALAAYVRSLGRELAQHNIICTGILPGGFISPGNSMARFKDINPEAYSDFIINRLPRNIMGQSEELIPMLSLLCSDKATMMNGCMVPIDAGEGVAYVN